MYTGKFIPFIIVSIHSTNIYRNMINMSETKPIPEYRDQENQDRHGSHPHGVYISKRKQWNLVKLFLKKLHIMRCYEEMKQEI